jgi:prepilin-type N-terminal cleavage/methylation domain-containing protein
MQEQRFIGFVMLLKRVRDEKGFSLIEILIGATVFSLGMLGIIALQLSSMKSTRFAGNMGLGMGLASSRIEELMLVPYDDTIFDDDNGDGTDQDLDNDGLDDDDPADTDSAAVDGVLNFGLDRNCHTDLDAGCPANADDYLQLGGWNGKYVLYWNVAVDEPIPNTKTINMIISWRVKDTEGGRQQVNFTTVKEEGI